MLENRLDSKYKIVIMFLLMLYPVLPLNYYVSVFSYANICAMCIALVYILGNRNLQTSNIFKYNFFFWLYLIVYANFALVTAGVATSFAWIVSKIVVSIVIIGIVSSNRDIFRIIDGIIIASIMLSIIGIIESFSHTYLIQRDIYYAWSDSLRYGILRSAGPFGHPINFAFYQAVAALLAFYRLNTDIARKKKKKYIIAYVLAVISMCLSVSRLAICFFVAAQIMIILYMGPRRAIKYLYFIFLAMVTGLILLDTFGFERFGFINDFLVSVGNLLGIDSQYTGSSVVGFGNRFDLYEWVIFAVGENSLFGNGVGAEFAYKMTDWFTKTSIEVHYLYIFFQCGIVGLVALIISYIGTIRYFFKHRKCKMKDENKLAFGKVLLTILILYYICLFGVQETDLTRMYCELVALGIAYVRVCQSSNS